MSLSLQNICAKSDDLNAVSFYDNADRLSAITHTYVPMMGPSTTLATYTYAYNAASELTVETNKDGTLTYTYDNTSQLTGVDGSGGTCGATGCDESFSFDVNGNRTMTGYTSGTGNRLTSDGTYNYTYDDNGNLITKTRITDNQKTEFSWDYRNRLTQILVKDSGGNILKQLDYTYDAFNHRIISTVDSDGAGPQPATTTKTLYDGASVATNPYADFDGSNSLTMRYLYGPVVDFLLARRNSSGTVNWYLADHLGTIRDVANTSGAIQDHVSYSAFGKVTTETNPSNGDRFKFTGREHESNVDEYHYRARTYDANTGRFVSQDTISFAGEDTNLYRYVANGPSNWVDPSGRGLWAWIYTGQWNPPQDVYAAAMEAAGQSYMANAGMAHQALNAIPHALAGAVDAFLELMEGPQLHQQVMAQAPPAPPPNPIPFLPPVPAPPNPGAPWNQKVCQFIRDFGPWILLCASVIDDGDPDDTDLDPGDDPTELDPGGPSAVPRPPGDPPFPGYGWNPAGHWEPPPGGDGPIVVPLD